MPFLLALRTPIKKKREDEHGVRPRLQTRLLQRRRCKQVDLAGDADHHGNGAADFREHGRLGAYINIER